MKTLEQVKKQVAVPKAGHEIPSEKKLREKEEVYESICIGYDVRITVYRNGYVVCVIGRRRTVFPISEAGYYTFGENESGFRRRQKTGAGGLGENGGNQEGGLSLDHEEWRLALYLAGEDRIRRNMDTDMRKKIPYTESYTRRLKKSETDKVFEKSWENQVLEDALSVLTDREKRVVWECCILQKTKTEVGKEMGYSTSVISKTLALARAKIRKSGVLTADPEKNPAILKP